MKKNLKTIFLVSVILFSWTLVFTADKKDAMTESPVNTIVTPHLGDSIMAGKNIVYCLSFQLAWDALKNDIIKEDVRMEDEPYMVRFLNKSLASKKDLDESSYIAMAGFGRDNIVAKINKTLKEKFKKNAPVLTENILPGSILAYAYMYKNLEFEKKFDNIENGINFNGAAAAAKAFGIKKYSAKEKAIAEQVQVLDYKNDGDFIIGVKLKSNGDQIVLAKIKPGRTFFNTIGSVQARIASAKPGVLANGDSLQIPKLSFDIQHVYKELIGKKLKLKNPKYDGMIIGDAVQAIKFRLNEKGAELKSSAKILILETALQEAKARNFIFDKPFLIYLKQKNSDNPYFAVWVGNDELMEKQ